MQNTSLFLPIIPLQQSFLVVVRFQMILHTFLCRGNGYLLVPFVGMLKFSQCVGVLMDIANVGFFQKVFGDGVVFMVYFFVGCAEDGTD